MGHMLLAELVPREPVPRYPSPGIRGAGGGGERLEYILEFNWEKNNVGVMIKMNFGFNSKFMEHKVKNVIDGAGDFSQTMAASHPSSTVTVGRHVFVVDSRQRDCKLYPTPSNFRIEMGDTFKNISSIELKGCILPKSSYNVHSSNKYIDFAIGNTVTLITMTNGGSGYTVPPVVTIASPVVGTTATATATINTRGEVSGVVVVVAGSGYSASKPPLVTISAPPSSTYAKTATAVATVGTHYTAVLREGNYILGGNPTPGTTVLPTGLLLELQNAMNYAVVGGAYNAGSVSPFVVRVVSQYPGLYAVAGTPEASDTNACSFNRIQITNVLSSPWEILWCSGPNGTRNMRRVLGFEWQDSTRYVATAVVNVSSGMLIPAGTTYRGAYDYDLIDDPNYVVMSFWAVSDESFERIQSKPVGGLNRAFATLVYDANLPENLMDLGGTSELVGGVEYLVGALGKGAYWLPQGTTKPLKGFDFDQKYLSFTPPLGKLSYLNITFTKYGQQSGGLPEYYDFQGRDVLLVFEFTSGMDPKGLVDT